MLSRRVLRVSHGCNSCREVRITCKNNSSSVVGDGREQKHEPKSVCSECDWTSFRACALCNGKRPRNHRLTPLCKPAGAEVPGASRTISRRAPGQIPNRPSAKPPATRANTPLRPPPTDNLPKRSRARGSSAQLPGSPWRRARCRRAPREGQPVVGVERPNGSLRFADEESSRSSRARALTSKLSSASSAAGRARRQSRVGQPQPWRNQSPRPSTTASIN